MLEFTSAVAAKHNTLQLPWDPEYFYGRMTPEGPSIFAPISIAFVSMDDKHNPFYAISADFREEWVPEGNFVRTKILSKLESEKEIPRVTQREFREQLALYVRQMGRFEKVELIHLESSPVRMDFLALQEMLGMDPYVFFEEYIGANLVMTNLADVQMKLCLLEEPENDDIHHPVSDAYWHGEFYKQLMEYQRDIENGVAFVVPPREASDSPQQRLPGS